MKYINNNNKYRYKHNNNIDVSYIDHIPIKDLITKSPIELFSIRKQCLIDFEISKYRKNWICNVIEMKYREDINNLLEKAKKYFECIDKYNISNYINKVPYFIKDNDTIIQVEFIRNNNNKDSTTIDIKLSIVKDEGRNEK